jgi:hypothetical protein
MYFATVFLLMLVFPLGSTVVEQFVTHGSVPLMLLAGKWFVFWSAGVRLFIAGLRQFFQPRFTSEQIFGIKSNDALPLVRELGIANFATGVVGMVSLAIPSFILPMAISGAIFYGVAGVRHLADSYRTSNENIAMTSDLFVSLIFIAYLVYVGVA